MGTWKMTDECLPLAVQDFEGGKGPGADRISLFLKHVEPQGE